MPWTLAGKWQLLGRCLQGHGKISQPFVSDRSYELGNLVGQQVLEAIIESKPHIQQLCLSTDWLVPTPLFLLGLCDKCWRDYC